MAIHEAGHVVVGYKLGFRVKSSEIPERAGWNGITKICGNESTTAVQFTALSFAGQEAEKLLFGTADSRRSEIDVKTLETIVSERTDIIENDQLQQLFSEGRQLAKNILQKHHGSIERVASELQAKLNLSESEIHELMTENDQT